ncbi:MAG TPA: hypothetical protein VGF92_18395 [Stellaceae bacterium]|jgi:hypothetical protein
MLTLAYCPGACSMAPHFVLEDGGEKYVARKVDSIQRVFENETIDVR